MDTLVIPRIDGEFQKERARDELPQSAAGKTIMTTEPKFIPEEAIELSMDDNLHFRVRLIDCVGYIVPSSVGYIEEDQPRMVHTPWFEEEIPFNMAAEIGTRKVINEHSTIGLVITTDGSISDIPRSEYEEAEITDAWSNSCDNMGCSQYRSSLSFSMSHTLPTDTRVFKIPVFLLPPVK